MTGAAALVAWSGVARAVEALPVDASEVLAAVTSCGPGFVPEPAQAFRLVDPGRPWNAHAVVTALDGSQLCLVHRSPDREPVVVRVPVTSCMNCTAEAVAGVGFEDVDGDAVPDLSVAVDGIFGWDPQELSGSRYVAGRQFWVWTAAPDWSALTPVPVPKLAGVKTLAQLWAAMRAERVPKPPSATP